MFWAARYDDLCRAVRETVVALQLGDDGLLQLVDADGGRVPREPLSNGRNGRLLHVCRRLKIRLTEAEVHNIDSVRLHLLGNRRNSQRGRGTGRSEERRVGKECRS